MALRMTILLLFLPALIGSAGCGSLTSRVTLHPIEQSDIVRMKTGTSYTATKDGWFLSDLYMKEVAQARVKE